MNAGRSASDDPSCAALPYVGSDRDKRALLERGFSMVVALVLLVILSLLGVEGLKRATLSERIAYNSEISDTLFQAAESGIEQAVVSYVELFDQVRRSSTSLQFDATAATNVDSVIVDVSFLGSQPGTGFTLNQGSDLAFRRQDFNIRAVARVGEAKAAHTQSLGLLTPVAN